MELPEIDLHGLGRFGQAPASFEISRFDLPQPWDYVFTNGEILLRVRQDGAGYLQTSPPSGVPLLSGPPLMARENGHVTPAWFTWIISHDSPRGEAFSNFFLPAVPLDEVKPAPAHFKCLFEPERALYTLTHLDWLVQTELFVPPKGQMAVMTVSLTNKGSASRSCTLMPVMKPHLAPLSQAPWDVAAWYQTAAFCGVKGLPAFWFQTRHPGGDPSQRLHAAMLTDFAPDTFEVSYDDFLGGGQWHCPAAVGAGRLAKAVAGAMPKYGHVDAANAAIGQPPLAAMAKTISLRAGERYQFTMVLAKLPDRADGKLPALSTLAAPAKYLRQADRNKALAQLGKWKKSLIAGRTLTTPDACLNRYVNEFLPLQAYWVSMLDRGWPTPFRGTRDASQDATSIIPIDPALARERLLEVFSHQRGDGWFPRAYFLHQKGALPASHVDAGAWVWEFLWEYLCYTRDFAALAERTPWLEAGKAATVLDHAVKGLDYYLHRDNLGRHGLCKIRGGDWNDSVNRAGVQGRGETVMLSCQVVMALEQAAELLKHLTRQGRRGLAPAIRRFEQGALAMRKNLLRHALNAEGYFSGVYNDAGEWVFSPKDPDGRRRVNGPANSFALIAGIVQGLDRQRVLDALNDLKGPHGWRLFHPAIGDKPISNLGRIGQGDLWPGLGENGTPYNHGSHGFLGRAAWSVGRGDMLYEVLRYMFPYDQSVHPVASCRTAPYGVVNHWKEAPGLDGIGGDVFLSGSIATALRNCYEGLVGFRPGLEHLVIDPCVPAAWPRVEASVPFMGGTVVVEILNPSGVESGVKDLRLDGAVVTCRLHDDRLGRTVAAIPLDQFKENHGHRIVVKLG